jgi:hypothetical protein
MLVIKKKTNFEIAPGAKLMKVAGSVGNLIQNAVWGTVAKTVTSITVGNVTIGGTTMPLCTVVCTNHGLAAGDYCFINRVSPKLLNGVHQVYSYIDANTYTILLAYDNGDTVANGSALPNIYIPTSSQPYNSISTTAANAIVTGTAFTTGSTWVGKSILMADTVNQVNVTIGVIQTVDSSTQITLTSGATGFTGTLTGAFTLLEPAKMVMYPVDEDITLKGVFDFDWLNNSPGNSYYANMIDLRRVHNLDISKAKFQNCNKYAARIGNAYNCFIDKVHLDENSDGIHLSGSGADITVQNIKGKAGDDIVVCGQGDPYFYLDTAYEYGDFDRITVRDMRPQASLTNFKYYGDAIHSMNDLTLENAGGYVSGGSGVFTIISDASCVGSEGGFATVNRFKVSGSWDYNSSKSFGNFAHRVIVNGFQYGELNVGLGNTSGTSNVFLLGDYAIVNDVTGSVLNYYASSGASSPNAKGWNIDGTSEVKRINAAVVSRKNVGHIVVCNNANNTDQRNVHTFGTINSDACGASFQYAGRVTLNIGFQYNYAPLVAQDFIFNNYTYLNIGKAFGLNGNVITLAAGKTLGINAPDIGIDPTSLSGTLEVSSNRPYTFFNTATGWGTCQRYNTVRYNVGLARWVQENPTMIDLETLTAWNSGTAYVVGDRVSVSSNNYTCIAANTNFTPPNTTYWKLDESVMLAWNSATAYIWGDRVSLGGNYYFCILANTNNTPPTSTYWRKVYPGQTYRSN